MTLTHTEIDDIAESATNLKAALTGRGWGENTAREAVVAAMPAIVAASTEAAALT